ncbi:MAG TPA: cytochrome c [Gemmatimonadales bacterium]|jgi:mono/diheme cytochrome c family protein
MSLRRRSTLLGLFLLATRIGAATAQTDSTAPAPSAAPGMYTVAQGVRGGNVYQAQCTRCHLEADHTGGDFRTAWQGLTVRSLFDYLRSTMPDDDPGTLSEQDYLDVTAYLLKLNGMPAGGTALTADSVVLKKLVIDIRTPHDTATSGRRRLRRLRLLR